MSWPKSRWGHATVMLDKHHVLMIGGYECNDCWLFNVETKLWKEVSHCNVIGTLLHIICLMVTLQMLNHQVLIITH